MIAVRLSCALHMLLNAPPVQLHGHCSSSPLRSSEGALHCRRVESTYGITVGQYLKRMVPKADASETR